MATGHLEKRYKSSWTIVIDAGRDADGKRIRITKSYKGRQRDAEQLMYKMINEINEGTHVKPDKLSVSQYLQKWLKDYCEPNLAPSTLDSYKMIIDKHLTSAIGNTPLQKLQPMHLQEYYSKALKEGRIDGKGGLSPRTVKYHHTIIKEALKHAVKWQLINRKVADAVEPPKQKSKPEMVVLDAPDVDKLLKAAVGHPDEDLITVALYTGARQAELLGLRWDDVDLKNRQIQIRRILQRIPNEGFSFKETKNYKGRQVSITDTVVNTLKAIKKHQARKQVATETGVEYNEYNLVFCRENGSPMDRSTITHRFKDLATEAGFPKPRFHDLRHTHATLLLKEGVHPKIVQERLGHKTINITLDTYSHVLPGLQEQAANKLEDLLGKPKAERF